MRVMPSLFSGIFSVIAVSLLFSAALPASSANAYSPDVNGARAFANSFCPDINYPEDKIADYMWVTAPDGTNQISAQAGVNQVAITINFYATYCANWPQGYVNGANGLQVQSGGVNKLIGGPGWVGYGNKTTGFGARSEWGTGQYAGTLNVTGWGTGWHNVCTWFTTTTTRPGAIMSPSPSACFDLYLTRINPWSVSGDSKVGVDFTPPNVSAWSARPGQTLYWRHSLTNGGPGNTSSAIGYAIGKSGFTTAWPNGAAPNNIDPQGSSVINANATFYVGWGQPAPRNAYSTYTVKDSDLGNNLCQSISWGPTAWNNGNWSQSTAACVNIPYNYNLLPSVTGPNGMGSVGSTIPTVTPRVNNQVVGNAAGTTASPPATEWQLKRIEVGPGKTIPMTQQQNGTLPCAHYQSGGAASCIAKGSGTRSFPAGSTTLALLANEQIGANTPAGTKICFTLSIRPYSQSTGNNWRHGVPVCITVSKQPKVQVWGSDLRARGSIDTGTTVISSGGSDKLFGSWVEYGGFSVGGNSGFASGSGLNNGNIDTTGTNSWNKLTFANVNAAGADSYGRFTLPALPDLATQFNGAASGAAINANLGALNSGIYKVGNFTINRSTIGQAKTIIVISTGTVTISDDITYGTGGSYSSIGELSQVIIIARTINIANTAKQIDAWLLTTGATGSINTCWAANRTVTAPLNSTVCNNQLTVNGPVVTEHLHLRRTAGSDSVANAGAPAEVFNLRPDAYLWAQARASQSGKAQTVYSVELPPRF